MDGILSDGRKGRLFFCKRHSGHVLGLKVSISTGQGFEDRLLLFRHAVAVADLSQARVVAKLDGTTHDIECEICGAMRSWWTDKKAVYILEGLYGKAGA